MDRSASTELAIGIPGSRETQETREFQTKRSNSHGTKTSGTDTSSSMSVERAPGISRPESCQQGASPMIEKEGVLHKPTEKKERVSNKEPLTALDSSHVAQISCEETETRGSEAQLTDDLGSSFQGRPQEFASLFTEIIFVFICSVGQLLFAINLENVAVNQLILLRTLKLPDASLSWLLGSFLVAIGLSVVISGTLADLTSPRKLMVGAFVWLTIWSVVGMYSINRAGLFLAVRSMHGLAVGVLVSASMSILGRTYKPGKRKVQVFSLMAAFSPLGAWFGALQGAACSSHLEWIFGSLGISSLWISFLAF